MCELITWHARLRWLERVDNVDVDAFRRDLAAIDEVKPEQVLDPELVQWILAAYEWTVEGLDDEMLSDGARAGVEGGCSAVINRSRGVKLVCNDRKVVTITMLNAKDHKKRSASLTRQWKNRRRRGRIQTAGERANEEGRS